MHQVNLVPPITGALEAVIVAGLKRPARRSVAANGQGGVDGDLPTLAELGDTVARGVRSLTGQLGEWAARALAPNSLNGLSLLLALCAAAWFSGGTESDAIQGALVLCGWLVTGAAARWCSGRGTSRVAVTGAAGSTDWLVLPGAVLDDPGRPADAGRPADPGWPADAGRLAHGQLQQADGAGWRRTAVRDAAWPAALCAVAAESSIYGGMAAGGQSAGWTGMWQLATAVIIAVAIRNSIGSRSASRNGSALKTGPRAGFSAVLRRMAARGLAPSVSGRVALAAVALAVHGPRVALFLILAVEVISICHAIVVTRSADDATRPDIILAARDDGAAARWTGRLVQGNLVPLPPALAGVTAAVLLAALGLGHLPGVIAFAPPAVMMLAAPGSGHPHDGRFDWLVPAVLQTGQYIYLAALGFASAVSGPLCYSLCALTVIWYANLAVGQAGTLAMLQRERDDASPPATAAGTSVGWEGRMFAVTLGALLGLATFAYLAVAAYLGVLIGRKVVSGYLLPREDDRR